MAVCIVVLGGGPPADDLSLPVWTQRRCDLAIALHEKLCSEGKEVYVATLSGGTAHVRDTIGPDGHVVHESTAAALHLARHGVPAARIFREWASYDTIGNAFFLRTTITDVRNLRSLIVITSEFHMPRTRAIFDTIFALDSPSSPYSLSYESVSDTGLDDCGLDERRSREARSLQAWEARSFASLAHLHEWLFTEHGCYAVAKAGSAADASAAAHLYGGKRDGVKSDCSAAK